MAIHEHNAECFAEIAGVWDSAFLRFQRAIRIQPNNPMLQYSLPVVFDALVIPTLRCPVLRLWFQVYLASPAIHPTRPLWQSERELVFLAQSLQDWFDQGLLTEHWAREGEPRLRAIARRLRLVL